MTRASCAVLAWTTLVAVAAGQATSGAALAEGSRHRALHEEACSEFVDPGHGSFRIQAVHSRAVAENEAEEKLGRAWNSALGPEAPHTLRKHLGARSGGCWSSAVPQPGSYLR